MSHDYSSLLFLIVPAVLGGRWAVKKTINTIKRSERKRINNLSNQRFVIDMARNHLPHQYHALELIAKHLGITLPDPPPIRFASPIDIKEEGNNEDLL
jgi:hypothetical protein